MLQYRASEEALGLVLLKRWLRLDVDPVKMKAQKGEWPSLRQPMAPAYGASPRQPM